MQLLRHFTHVLVPTYLVQEGVGGYWDSSSTCKVLDDLIVVANSVCLVLHTFTAL